MKRSYIQNSLLFLFTVILAGNAFAQNPKNWTDKQLMEPSVLAQYISSQKNVPIIISVGPGALIPNSIDAGMASTPEGLEKLKTELKKMDKNQQLVIYCGCCPFEHCPNIRPAIELVKTMNFTNYYLLDLSHNIKIDWINKGYPVKKL